MTIRRKIILFDLLITGLLLAAFILFLNFTIDTFFDDITKIEKFKKNAKLCVFGFSLGFVFINRAVGVVVTSRVLTPIQQILKALRSFKEGEEELLPPIVLQAAAEGEFSRLASTLNALRKRVQRQIENLKNQQEEIKKILESLGEGVIAFDPSAKVIFINTKAAEILNTPLKTLLGRPLTLNQGPLLEKCHQLVLHALQTSESLTYRWIVREKMPLYLELISSPLAHQEGALLVLQDKTSDYRVVEMGKDFVANASHELRTPITIIRGFAETLQDHPDLAKDMQAEIIGKIVKTCGRLDKLVRSLLTLADVENLPPLGFKTVNLIPLVENCVHLITTSSPKTEIIFDTKYQTAFIPADADLLELAILNILENGIKYSKEPARLEITVQIKANRVQLILKDRGIGMSDADLNRIFDRFYTVDKARSRKSGGTGLGLSIVKTIMDKHQGSIHVQSHLGKGSTFTLCLPKASQGS